MGRRRRNSAVKRKYNNVVEANTEEASHRGEGNKDTKIVSPKTVELGIIGNEYTETKTDLTMHSHAEYAVSTRGVPEKVESSAFEEKNEDLSTTCNPEEQVQEENLITSQAFSHAPASMLTHEDEMNARTFQDPDFDPDILLTSSVEETQVNPHTFQNNETSWEASDEHNKPGNGAENPQNPYRDSDNSTPQSIVPYVQLFHPGNSSYITICNDEHQEPQILPDLNNDGDLTFVPDKIPSFNGKEKFSGDVEANNSREATMEIHGRQSAGCNPAAVLTSQNDALLNEVHGLKNEIASLSCQMFDLEARCSKVESTNQQLLCRIREYADLGSREEIIRCGEQIGQFTDFLQAMLQEIPVYTETGNNTCEAGPSFFQS